jgi:archaellum component FlaC
MKTIKEEINNIKENMQDIKELLNRIANKWQLLMSL